MSQNEKPAPAGLRTCDNQHDAGPIGITCEAGGPATGSETLETGPSGGVPVTRSPYDCWHSEAYLIGWLVKTHGWRVVSPGRMERPRLARTAPQVLPLAPQAPQAGNEAQEGQA